MDATPPLLAVTGLAKAFAGVRAVDDLSFTLAERSITGLIGPNGSGKSTTVDCISGFQTPDAGRVVLDGRDISGLPPHEIARAGLLRTFQTVRVYDELSLLDNLLVAMQPFEGTLWRDDFFRTRRVREAERDTRARAVGLIDLIGLARYRQAPVGILSYGQKKLVALAAALMPGPKLVVLDEPVAGVNPTRVREVERILRELHDRGASFLVIEHNVEFVMNLCDRVIVLDQGAKLTEGTPAEVHADERVLEAYLGR
jgi:branched-chain amino acid transport system ATP-binding protein